MLHFHKLLRSFRYILLGSLDSNQTDVIISNVSFQIQIKPNLRSSNKFNVSIEMDDWILLEGCGQLTQWKFPAELKVCPVKKCGIQFTVRSDAIVHYKNLHAKNTILCSICDVPIYAERLKDLEKHYHGAHPDEEFKFNQNSTQASEVCNLLCQFHDILVISFLYNFLNQHLHPFRSIRWHRVMAQMMMMKMTLSH